MSIRDTINTFLPDKETMYEWMIRLGYFMPAFNSSIISVKFMDRILREDIFMPKFTDLHPARIAKPPTKKEMKDELIRIMEGLDYTPAAK